MSSISCSTCAHAHTAAHGAGVVYLALARLALIALAASALGRGQLQVGGPGLRPPRPKHARHAQHMERCLTRKQAQLHPEIHCGTNPTLGPSHLTTCAEQCDLVRSFVGTGTSRPRGPARRLPTPCRLGVPSGLLRPTAQARHSPPESASGDWPHDGAPQRI